jgi:NAD(P)-dependent dehydrogenase (short-subunit alcohol dehydrogenase family)
VTPTTPGGPDVSRYTFDGRVAVVTGAARGIGRAYADLLAERGARLVVNDLGGTMEGDGADPEPARRAAEEIVAAGGTAIPDANDVSTVEGGRAVVAAAMEAFGRIDIIINNAGNIRWGGLPEVDADNLNSHLAVHVGGSFHTTRAAWPHLIDQNYGRVVLTTSTGMFGLADNLGYATAKAAVIGMARSLAVAGAPHGIKVNLIAPSASTRMGVHPSDGLDALNRPTPTLMEPAIVAPLVAYLAHEACQVSGGAYLAGAGRFARLFVGVTPGYVPDQPDHSSIEDVASHWANINDESGYYVPADLRDWSTHYMAHIH